MIRALIVDDEEPARRKLRMWLAAQPDLEIAGEAADGVSALRAIDAGTADVVFLDIQMPGLTGLEVAAQLEISQAPLLVFVTAYDAHAVQAFDLNAIDYLLKPYDQERFDRALNRVRERWRACEDGTSAVLAARAQTGSSHLLVPLNGGLQLIESNSIHSLEADDNYVQVQTAERSYLLRRTLQDLLRQLGEDAFVRIHKSTAVNIAQINVLAPLFKGDYELRLKSGKLLRVSRRYAAQLFNRMGR